MREVGNMFWGFCMSSRRILREAVCLVWLKVPKVTEPEPPHGGRTVNALVQSSRRCASPVARLSGRCNGEVCACQGGSPGENYKGDELDV